MKKYKDKMRPKVKNATPEAIEVLTYEQVAALCEVTLDAQKNSPADFFYEHLRRDIANERRAEIAANTKAVRKAKLQAKIDADPDLAGLTVVEDAEGNLEIK